MFYSVSFLLCSALSLISTAALLFYYVYEKSSRTFAFKLVLPIFLYDFILSLGYFCPLVYYFLSTDPYLNDPFCRLQGFTKLFATNGTFCSTLAISWTLYSFFIRQKPIKTQNPIQFYGSFLLLLPLFLSVLPFFFDSYDHTQPLSEIMCFLVVRHPSDGSTDVAGIFLKIFCSLFPFFLTVLLEIFFVLRILYDFWQKRENRYSTDMKYLILYPLFLLLTWIWIMFERLYELVTNGQQLQWMNDFDLQITVFNGFINSLIYGYFSINPFHSCCNYNSDEDNKNKLKEIESQQSESENNEWESNKSDKQYKNRKQEKNSAQSLYEIMLEGDAQKKTAVAND